MNEKIEVSKNGLSEILNAIDGISSYYGRILIFTTNHIEKLDPALIRPGRMNVKLELGYVDEEMFSQFAKLFFDVDYSFPEGKSMV